MEGENKNSRRHSYGIQAIDKEEGIKKKKKSRLKISFFRLEPIETLSV